jgi:hypothetical protein
MSTAAINSLMSCICIVCCICYTTSMLCCCSCGCCRCNVADLLACISQCRNALQLLPIPNAQPLSNIS